MRTHWFVSIYPWIRRAVQFVIWILGGYGGLSSAVKGYDPEILVLVGLSCFALACAANYWVLKLGDYWYDYFSDINHARQFAAELRDRLSVGVRAMTTNAAADMWAGLNPAERNQHRDNTKFRWIKSAVDSGFVNGAPLNEHGMANRNTVIQINDLEKFLSRRDWRMLVDRTPRSE